ncbi:MAG: hypothetical protein B7Z55_10305, partial [Planctomycetales bacterium 12-60-4]
MAKNPDQPPLRCHTSRDRPSPRCRSCLIWIGLTVAAVLGCGVVHRPATTGLPDRHKVSANQLVVQSDIRLPKTHPLIQDLETLRGDIARTLNLPLQKQPVTVYLFADEV